MAGTNENPVVDADLLHQKLTNALERLCQEYLVYVKFVGVSGKLIFKVDDTQKLEVLVSQIVLPGPVPFEDEKSNEALNLDPGGVIVIKPEAEQNKTVPAKRGRGGRKSKYTGVKKKELAVPSTNKRRRGRPRKQPIMVDLVETDKENGNNEVSCKAVKCEKSGDLEVPQLNEAKLDPDSVLEGGIEEGEGEEEEMNFTDDGAIENSSYDMDYTPLKESRRRKPHRESEDGQGMVLLKKRKIKKLKTTVKRTIRFKTKSFCKKFDYYEVKTTNPLECYRCKDVCETTEELQEHKKSKHGGFLCEECPYVTDSSQKLRLHIHGRHTNKTLPCTECGKRFSQEDSLKKHIKNLHTDCWKCPVCEPILSHSTRTRLVKHLHEQHSDHPESWEVLICDLCKLVLMTVQELEEHKTSVHTHVCSTCGAKFNSLAHMVKHRMKAHPQQALTCEKCGKVCANKQAMYRHLERHREKEHGKFTCPECQKEFTSRNSLFHHTRGLHAKEKKYKCKECNKEFNFHHSLKLHVYKHTGARPHKCKLCQKSYLTSNHLKNHVEAVHGNSKKYVCPVCNKGFPYDNSLRMHMLLHDKNRPFVCDQCGKSFVAKSALKAHEELHTNEFHKCPVCNKMYRTKMLLRAHTRRHTNDGHRYMCDICGNTFMYQSTLNTHMIVHGDSRSFECVMCNKSFKTYATLYSHRLVHDETIPFTCNICGKGFKTRERVKAHEKRHAGEKPYQCEQCGSSFPDKGGLSKHNKTVHARRPRFQCPSCGKMANRADNLRVHMKIHNDPGLMEMKAEDLMIKPCTVEEPEEDGETDIGLALPAPRKRRGGAMKKEPRVNIPLGVVPNINVGEINLDAVAVLTAEQQQQIILEQHHHQHQQQEQQPQGIVGLSDHQQLAQQQQEIVAEFPREITFTLEKVTLDKMATQGILMDHLQKVHQQQQQQQELQSVTNKQQLTMHHKQLAGEMQDFDKSLQKQQSGVVGVGAGSAVHTGVVGGSTPSVFHVSSQHLNHAIESLQNPSMHHRLEQIIDLGQHGAGGSNTQGINLQLHNANINTSQALIVSQAPNPSPSVITNPLLHLAEVMSGQHQTINTNNSQVGINYATLQQFQPFVTTATQQAQPQTSASSFVQNFPQS